MAQSVDFQRLFQLAPNAYMLLDRELRYVDANAAYLAVTGSRREDLVGRHIFEVFPDNENSRLVRSSFERVLATRAPDALALIQYRIPKKAADGSVVEEDRFWSASHLPLLDANGEVEFILQHTVDVTDVQRLRNAAASPERSSASVEQGVLGRARLVQQANDLLLEERGHLRRLFNQAPGFFCFLRGPEHVFELINPAYERLVGKRDLLGKKLRDALPELEGQGYFEALDRAFATGAPFVGSGMPALLQRSPGAEPERVVVDFVFQPILNAEGDVSGIFVQGNDISTQKRQEVELAALLERERRARLRAELVEQEHRFLAEAIPQQVWTARPDGNLDFVNDRVLAYFARTREDILGTGWTEGVHPDDVAGSLAAWGHAVATGESYEVEFRLRRADGVWRWHLGRAMPYRDAGGSILHWYGTNTDIDETKRARDELQARTEFEEQLIGIVSHDLRNPLSAIGVLGSLLLRRGNLDDSQGKSVGKIISLTERAGRLIRDFLDFSQARSAGKIPIQPGPANLRELTRQVVDEVHLAHPERRVEVQHHGDVEGQWDADRIAQVIGNLVANAFQHSPGGAAVRVRSRIEGDRAEVQVHNDGPPIPDSNLARLFAPFQRGDAARTNNPGRSVGLGLYISQAIVVAHGGHIEVSSSAADGTRFTLHLPRTVAA